MTENPAGREEIKKPPTRRASGLVSFLRNRSDGFEARVSGHQPFDALTVERYLQPAVFAAAFKIHDGAFTEFRMTHALAELIAGVVLRYRRAQLLMADRRLTLARRRTSSTQPSGSSAIKRDGR